MWQAFIEQNRLFTILHESLLAKIGSKNAVLSNLIAYAEFYIRENHLDSESVESFYTQYIKDYRKDISQFEKTGQYPPQFSGSIRAIKRVEYDIILILSTLFTYHRFRIMELLSKKSKKGAKALFIGVGPGVELYLTQQKFAQTIAYDTSINPIVRQILPNIDFKETYFEGQGTEKYDQIFLVEILEHLEDPYSLLLNCQKVLSIKGEIHLTTATNIPQFDHLYNFADDHIDFEKFLSEHHFTIKYKEILKHDYLTKDVGSKNHYYIIKNNAI